MLYVQIILHCICAKVTLRLIHSFNHPFFHSFHKLFITALNKPNIYFCLEMNYNQVVIFDWLLALKQPVTESLRVIPEPVTESFFIILISYFFTFFLHVREERCTGFNLSSSLLFVAEITCESGEQSGNYTTPPIDYIKSLLFSLCSPDTRC